MNEGNFYMSDTAKQKHSKEPARILDIFLCVDPLDVTTPFITNEVRQFIESIEKKTYFHILPYHTLHSTELFLKKNNLPIDNITLRNNVYQTSYIISLSYRAAKCQGKKKAHLFLSYLSQFSDVIMQDLSDKYILEAAKMAGLDISMLLEDTYSDTIKEIYKRDRQIINQFAIKSVPSMVIFDSQHASGILLDQQQITLENIQALLCKKHGDTNLQQKNFTCKFNHKKQA